MIKADMPAALRPLADCPKAPDGDFSSMEDAFAAAAAASPDQLHSAAIVFGGRPAALLVVGDTLAGNVTPAFQHLVNGTPADGGSYPMMKLWDGAATGISGPIEQVVGEWIARGQDWNISTYGGFRFLCENRPNSQICLDRATGGLVARYRDGGRLSLSARARPLQRIMSQVCASFAIQDVHAGLVSHNGRGVLIVGGGGRGKSTTSIDCLYGGLDFLGDDSVGIEEAADGGFIGHSIYGSARVFPIQLRRWPRFVDAFTLPGPDDDKALLLAAKSFPSAVVRTTRIIAIAVPHFAEGRTRVVRTSPRDAFRALVYESKDNLRFGMKAADFLRLSALAKTTPCYRIGLGINPEVVAADIAGLIDGAAP